MSAPELKPCPFCGGGITSVEGGGQIWRGVNGYSEPQFYHLRHFGKLSETDDFPRCSVEFRCRTEAEAIVAWNTRADTATWNAAIRAAADWIESAPNGTRFQDRDTILALLKEETK